MKTASILTIGCAAMALSITSCTNFGSPNTYNLNEIGGAHLLLIPKTAHFL